MLYRVGDFVFDLRKFELRKGGRALAAEPQVLSLLFLLVENRDRLISKDELIATVWNGRSVSDSAISSRIKTARKLLGDDGDAQRLIRTVHGRGFRFVGDVSGCEVVPDSTRRNGSTGKPSMAVLPFDFEEPALAVLADGIPHDLIVGLSRLRSLRVIARGSSFRFRRYPGDLSQVAAALSVHYLVTGSVRRSGARVQLSVELVDAWTNSLLWGDVFEGEQADLHDFRRTILLQVVSSLDLRISSHEAGLAGLRHPNDLDAWSCYHLGLQHIFRFNRNDNARALELFEQSARLDPAFSRAHSGISHARFQNAFMGYAGERRGESRLAREAAERALKLDEEDPTANLMMGRSLWLDGRVESSLPWLQRSIALSPSYAQALYAQAWTHMILNHAESGRQDARAALGLSPVDPLRYAMMATDGFTQAMLGEERKGAELVDRAAREPRAHVMIAAMAAICQVWAGDAERTRYWSREIRSRGRKLTRAGFLSSFPFANGAVRKRVADALVAIGL